MNHETELKLQAYLDGELSESEATAIREMLAHDPEARSVTDALEATRTILLANEPELKVPETREFYWSKIGRQIELGEEQGAVANAGQAAPAWWLRFLAPAGLLAVLIVLIALSLRAREGASPIWAMDDGHEIETPLEETSSFSFRSEAAAMTVVWVDSHRE